MTTQNNSFVEQFFNELSDPAEIPQLHQDADGNIRRTSLVLQTETEGINEVKTPFSGICHLL